MQTQIIQFAYDSGYKNFGMGLGPAHIIRGVSQEPGLCKLPVETVEVNTETPLEVGTTFQALKALAKKVGAAVEQGRLPLVLAGGCMSSIGTVAGLGAPTPAVLWLDAHGDFNTPETTTSGFLDGMSLATLVGRCWTKLSATVTGFRPVPECQTALLGARQFDEEEHRLLGSSQVTVIPGEAVRQKGVLGALQAVLGRLLANGRRGEHRLYLHLDLDVLDANEACSNQFSCAGGLTLVELLDVVRIVREQCDLAAAAITAYDPKYDQCNKALSAAVQIVKALTNPA